MSYFVKSLLLFGYEPIALYWCERIIRDMKKLLTLFVFTFFIPITPQAEASDNLFYYFANTYGFESLKDNYRDIDIFAPQVYEMDFAYDILEPGEEDQKVLDYARKKRMDVMPLVYNTGFSMQLMTYFLADEDAQEKVLDQLVDIADDEDYIGWQFDFENISHTDREAYTEFVEKAAKVFKKERLEFSVAVVPRSRDYDPDDRYQDWSAPYEYAKIAEVVDFMTLMTYDDEAAKGPVASLPFIDRILDYMIEEEDIDPEKISLGVPAYCWQWELGAEKKDRSHIYNRVVEKYEASDPFHIRIYLEELGSEAFFYIDEVEQKPYLTWCDNYQGFRIKDKIVKDRDLHGMSVWALGQEDERIWDEL